MGIIENLSYDPVCRLAVGVGGGRVIKVSRLHSGNVSMDVVEDKVQEWVRRPLMVMVSAWKWQQGQVWDSFKVESRV